MNRKNESKYHYLKQNVTALIDEKILCIKM